MKNDNNAIAPEAPRPPSTVPSGSLSIASGKSQANTVEPYNTVTLGPLTRNDLKLLLTCEASNNNLTLPTSLVVMVDMNQSVLVILAHCSIQDKRTALCSLLADIPVHTKRSEQSCLGTRGAIKQWFLENAVLEHNITGGVIVSNQSLVLQGVTRGQAGRYSCHAHNPVGDGASNTLRLDVKSRPGAEVETRDSIPQQLPFPTLILLSLPFPEGQ
ncbi:hypothetical protein Pcinc_041447 [Petrolisthes cinctipes]|uniref:Ig-like domain-containing protein n=1 Tax=Petrolisthes cinctipes TaxID=88211 RepID=A0AAE1EGX4_PETCI|nr:hypothetical protein Pcinc_041447 [Petrolisthes cinctipes]